MEAVMLIKPWVRFAWVSRVVLNGAGRVYTSTLDWSSSLGKACQVQRLKASTMKKGTEGDPEGSN